MAEIQHPAGHGEQGVPGGVGAVNPPALEPSVSRSSKTAEKEAKYRNFTSARAQTGRFLLCLLPGVSPAPSAHP